MARQISPFARLRKAVHRVYNFKKLMEIISGDFGYD